MRHRLRKNLPDHPWNILRNFFLPQSLREIELGSTFGNDCGMGQKGEILPFLLQTVFSCNFCRNFVATGVARNVRLNWLAWLISDLSQALISFQ